MHINPKFMPAGTIIHQIFPRLRAYIPQNPVLETIRGRKNRIVCGVQKNAQTADGVPKSLQTADGVQKNVQTADGGPKSISLQLLRVFLSIAISALLLPAAGCAVSKQDAKKLQDVEYTIVEDRGIPEKLMETIERKKEAEFKISFENDDGMYLVHGYGEQETGGYSIAVRDLYLTGNALYFDTELLGPKNGSNPQKKPSFPYIVVKTKKYKQNIVFE